MLRIIIMEPWFDDIAIVWICISKIIKWLILWAKRKALAFHISHSFSKRWTNNNSHHLFLIKCYFREGMRNSFKTAAHHTPCHSSATFITSLKENVANKMNFSRSLPLPPLYFSSERPISPTRPTNTVHFAYRQPDYIAILCPISIVHTKRCALSTANAQMHPTNSVLWCIYSTLRFSILLFCSIYVYDIILYIIIMLRIVCCMWCACFF